MWRKKSYVKFLQLILDFSWSGKVYLSIQMKATEQYFPVVLFIMLHKAVLSFESVNEILKCDHSNESY